MLRVQPSRIETCFYLNQLQKYKMSWTAILHATLKNGLMQQNPKDVKRWRHNRRVSCSRGSTYFIYSFIYLPKLIVYKFRIGCRKNTKSIFLPAHRIIMHMQGPNNGEQFCLLGNIHLFKSHFGNWTIEATLFQKYLWQCPWSFFTLPC